jgi:hypothetical protein
LKSGKENVSRKRLARIIADQDVDQNQAKVFPSKTSEKNKETK